MSYKSKYTGEQVENLLGKAGTSLQSTDISRVATTGNYNDLSNKPTIPDISGKQDILVSGTNIKTINGESILGSGDITIEGGNGGSDANVQAVDTSETLDDINTSTYVKYVAQTLTDAQKTQARTNIGAISQSDLSNVTVDLSNYYTKEEIDDKIGDINSVLESIISGGPSINLISITVDDYINGTSYVCQAEEGMTWGDWINSKYNTYGWYIDTSADYIFISDVHVLAYMGGPFDSSHFTDVMEDGAIGFHTYNLNQND